MAQLKRCDKCKRISDTIGEEERAYGISTQHTIKYSLDGRYTNMMEVRHPQHDLCYECTKQIILDGNTTIQDGEVREY